MSSIYIVGGSDHIKLKKYLESRGSLDVRGSINTLLDSKDEISASIINVDKLIYLYFDDSINIRAEMNTLRLLLQNDGFFRTKEVVFFIRETDVTKEGIRFIKTIENQLKEDASFETNFILNIRKEALSYDNIYTELLGLSEFGSDYKNSEFIVYRAERGNQDKRIYIGSDCTDMSVEPFDLTQLNLYNKSKDALALTEQGVLVHEDRMPSVKRTNPNIDLYELEDNTCKTKLFFVCGDRVCGKSNIACAISSSLFSLGEKVLLVDLTGRNNMQEPFVFTAKELARVGVAELSGYGLIKEPTQISYYDSDNRLDIFTHAYYIYSNLSKTGITSAVIEIDIDNYRQLLKYFPHGKINTIFVSNRFKRNIKQIQDIEKEYNMKSVCILTGAVRIFEKESYADNELVRNMLNSKAAVVNEPLQLIETPELINSLAGVLNEA